ncbi:hypothetical protein C7408_1338 [Paraburkholderia caballeronis]|nr:hypothetical protein C7408_1338 [Paraburkholderia caballeronis]TDV07709.1 hypothetical protein C7406_1358 [Paraburkholderia caballeronis]TDV17740.1 hypothetical protein C7404_1358 [Paraburkholderia caballeronis]
MRNIHGNIAEYVMPIMSQVIRTFCVVAAFFATYQSSMAETPLPSSVELNSHRTISANARELEIADGHRKRVKIRVPARLGKAMSDSSEIVFPESNSLVIDGREFFLVIVGAPSTRQPMGYCGAGTESKLYALQIDGANASIAFEKLIQSCLKNIDLASDGVAPAYRSISWSVHPAGIRVRWMSDEKDHEVSRIFQYRHGQFVEIPIS